jgi:hypothetical protein
MLVPAEQIIARGFAVDVLDGRAEEPFAVECPRTLRASI